MEFCKKFGGSGATYAAVFAGMAAAAVNGANSDVPDRLLERCEAAPAAIDTLLRDAPGSAPRAVAATPFFGGRD